MGRLSRATEGDGIGDLRRNASLELAVGLRAKGVVDGGERQPQSDEDCHREDLGIIEAGVPEGLDVARGRRVIRFASEVMPVQAWRVHGFGKPRDTFVLDEVAEPMRESLAGLGMSLGWVAPTTGFPPYRDWVVMEMYAAADVPAAVEELANRETTGRTVVRVPR